MSNEGEARSTAAAPNGAAGGDGRAQARREALLWALAIGLLFLVYQVIASFLVPLIWAVVISIFFYPVHRRLVPYFPRRGWAALCSTLLVAVLLIAPVAALAPMFVIEAGQAISGLPSGSDILERVQGWLDMASAKLPPAIGNLDQMVEDGLRALRDKIGGWTAKFVANLAGFILDFIVLMLALYYLFRDGEWLVDFVREISPFEGRRHGVIVGQTIDMIQVTINSSFVVAGVQGLAGGASFAVLGLPSPLLWGVTTAVMAFLPFLGAWMVWLPAGIALIVQGQVGRGVTLLALGAVLISLVDNILRPILISGRTRLNGLLVFISVLGGIPAFGLLGIVLGPLVMATAVGLLTGYRESLAAEDGSEEARTGLSEGADGV